MGLARWDIILSRLSRTPGPKKTISLNRGGPLTVSGLIGDGGGRGRGGGRGGRGRGGVVKERDSREP